MPDIKGGETVIPSPVLRIHDYTDLPSRLSTCNRRLVIHAFSERVVSPQTQASAKPAIYIDKAAVVIVDTRSKENSRTTQLGITAKSGWEVLGSVGQTGRTRRCRANRGDRLIGICAKNLMKAARTDVAHAKADAAGEGLLDFKVIVIDRRRIRVPLNPQAAASRRRARQRSNSRHDLQWKGNIARDLRSSCDGRNIDATPTNVVQQIVGHAETASNARLTFPERVPGQRHARSEKPLGTILCEQRIANPRLREQNTVRSLSEAGGQVIVGMVAVRKLVTQSQTQSQVGPELHGVL